MSTPNSHAMAEVPSEYRSSLAAAPPRSMPQTCTPDCDALGAEPIDRTPPRPHTQKSRWDKGGTHRYVSFVSAESQLGTLPVSVLLLTALQTRSGLGRSAVLRRTDSYPRTAPIGGVPREYS